MVLAVSRAIPLGESVLPVQPSPTFPVERLPLRPFEERRRIDRYAAVRSARNRRVDRPNGVSQRPRFMAALNNPPQDRSIRIQRS